MAQRLLLVFFLTLTAAALLACSKETLTSPTEPVLVADVQVLPNPNIRMTPIAKCSALGGAPCDRYEIIGDIQNVGTADATTIYVTVDFLDAAGTRQATDTVRVSGTLAPAKLARFDAMLEVPARTAYGRLDFNVRWEDA